MCQCRTQCHDTVKWFVYLILANKKLPKFQRSMGVATDFLPVQHFAHRWDKRESTAEIIDMYSEVYHHVG